MPMTCLMNGKCFYCMSPKRCHEAYGRPFKSNEAAFRLYGLSYDEDSVVEDEKKSSGDQDKPGFLRALSIWTYWKIMNLIWAVLKALRSFKK